MLEPYFSKELSDRQVEVVLHYLKNLGLSPETMHYIKSEEYAFDVFPIDIAVFKPIEQFDYYIATTVGLSSYRFDSNFARSELFMVLPNTWKPIMDKEEYYWPLQMLRDIAYAVVNNNVGVAVGQVYVLNEEGENYSPSTDAVGVIITIPEILPIEFFEEKIGETYTRFFQVTPVTANDVSKIEDIGPSKFIEYELHDSEKPLTVVKLKEKETFGIDKIIKHNEDVLKGKKD